jgi:hypothetical protein
MPVKVIRYLCKFRCGHKASKLETIKMHEPHCFKDPKNKACRMCDNLVKDSDTLYCDALKLLFYNLENKVENEKGKIIWPVKSGLFEDVFGPEKPRPFPRSNCDLFIEAEQSNW